MKKTGALTSCEDDRSNCEGKAFFFVAFDMATVEKPRKESVFGSYFPSTFCPRENSHQKLDTFS